MQITAEQVLREAKELQEQDFKPPKQKITDQAELDTYRLRKRKEFEDLVRRVRWNQAVWIKARAQAHGVLAPCVSAGPDLRTLRHAPKALGAVVGKACTWRSAASQAASQETNHLTVAEPSWAPLVCAVSVRDQDGGARARPQREAHAESASAANLALSALALCSRACICTPLNDHKRQQR